MKPYYQDEWVTIYLGDCREILSQLEKVDLVLTDPPYSEEYLSLFEVLSLHASQLLKNDSLLFCYSGQYHLPAVINRLSKHLQYRWIIALLHSGATQVMWSSRMIVGWKPVLLYSLKGAKYGIHWDIIQPEGRDKSLHKWQQPERGYLHIISKYTEGGDLILDPFLGSGTTAYCAKKLNRRCIGIEIEEKYCEIAAERCSQSVMDFSERR